MEIAINLEKNIVRRLALLFRDTKTVLINVPLLISVLISMFITAAVKAQRITDKHQLGWYALNLDYFPGKRWGLHVDLNNRREDLVKATVQNLIRVGVNFKPNEKIMFRAGYAFVENNPYGEYPINAFGKKFTEHRTYQMVFFYEHHGKLEVSHRIGLEQRWVGRYSSAELERQDEFNYVNRARYQIRLIYPLTKDVKKGKYPYLTAYNEIFLGFGANIRENVFDQNRLGFLIGQKFNRNIRIEAGYMNLIQQLQREVNENNVYQHNNNLTAVIYINI